jgi:hypothetical protein
MCLFVATAILSIESIIVVLPSWLLITTTEQHLGGETVIIVPAGLASIGCFGLMLGLLFFYRRKLDY